MKKTILSFVALCVGVFAMAQTSFYVYKTDKSTVEYAVSDVDSISFTKPATGTVSGYENGYGYVDLGLPSGLLWATCNVGATSPEGYGNYYAWGETETKDNYSWDTYKYGADYNELTKYCTDSSYGKDGFTDELTTLEAEDDAASVNWGGAWRTPTDDEWTELREQCDWTWTADYNSTGVAGRIVTSKVNGNSIFLPAAGTYGDSGLDGAGYDGNYWSGSLYTGNPYVAWYVRFYSGSVGRDFSSRYCGQSVRPVLP